MCCARMIVFRFVRGTLNGVMLLDHEALDVCWHILELRREQVVNADYEQSSLGLPCNFKILILIICHCDRVISGALQETKFRLNAFREQ